jgi:hypothetical protein
MENTKVMELGKQPVDADTEPSRHAAQLSVPTFLLRLPDPLSPSTIGSSSFARDWLLIQSGCHSTFIATSIFTDQTTSVAPASWQLQRIGQLSSIHGIDYKLCEENACSQRQTPLMTNK